ncbi:MAG: hypothetical protein RR933_08870, partial [Oscillospiraceae bacterium]
TKSIKNKGGDKFMDNPISNNKVAQIVEEAAKVDADFDPNGSYTGNPVNEGETPTQDADDL